MLGFDPISSAPISAMASTGDGGPIPVQQGAVRRRVKRLVVGEPTFWYTWGLLAALITFWKGR